MTCEEALEFIVAEVEGKLSADESVALREHLVACDACRFTALECADTTKSTPGHRWSSTASAVPNNTDTSKIEPSASSDPAEKDSAPANHKITEIPPGARWGRYIVLETVGSGGMGVVYAAYDSVLDRKVALKLLLDGSKSSSLTLQSRLLREAKAMAQLSHPNVVAVHDVGVLESQVFVSMEYVDGVNLRQWLRDRPRSWQEVLTVFSEAAQGLAAAHAVGLVHRDFTPANVLIGRDGRARVTDFGLARLTVSAGNEAAAPTGSEQQGADTSGYVQALAMPLTRDSQILGTPPYMAPEQQIGRAVTALSDQFSYCVALYEALYGQRPFAGQMLDELAAGISEGRINQKPPTRTVPSWLRKVVLRGLRRHPDERYPSMEALLGALAKGRAAATRRGLPLAGGLLAVVAALGAALLSQQDDEERCRRGIDHLQGVWDENKKAAIQRAFVTSGAAFSRGAWTAVEETVDAYVRDWLAMHYDTCAATYILHEQSERVLDLRMLCLRERLAELSSLTQLYEAADADVVENAVAAAQKLSRIETCANGVALSASLAPPDDEQLRLAVEQLRDRIAKTRNLDRVGKTQKASGVARAVVSEAERLGYRPLVAEAMQLVGEIQMNLHELDAARSTLMRAGEAAEAVGHDAVKALAWIQLAYVSRQLPGESDTADGAVRLAAAVLERNQSLRELEILLQSVAGLRRLDKGDTTGALESFERAATLAEDLFGPLHPRLASQLGNMGEVYCSTGAYEKALEMFRRESGILEKTYGPQSPLSVVPLTGMALALIELARGEEALAHLRRQLDVFRQAYGPRNGRLAKTHSLMGRVLALSGHFEAALEHQRTAVGMAKAAYGGDHWRVARSLRYLGDTLLLEGRYPEALETFGDGWAIYENRVEPGDPEPARILAGIGRAYLGIRRPVKALEPLHHSLELWEQVGGQSPHDSARARFAYARALASTNRDAREARYLARSAGEVFAAGGAATAGELDQVRDWLAKRQEPFVPVAREGD